MCITEPPSTPIVWLMISVGTIYGSRVVQVPFFHLNSTRDIPLNQPSSPGSSQRQVRTPVGITDRCPRGLPQWPSAPFWTCRPVGRLDRCVCRDLFFVAKLLSELLINLLSELLIICLTNNSIVLQVQDNQMLIRCIRADGCEGLFIYL